MMVYFVHILSCGIHEKLLLPHVNLNICILSFLLRLKDGLVVGGSFVIQNISRIWSCKTCASWEATCAREWP